MKSFLELVGVLLLSGGIALAAITEQVPPSSSDLQVIRADFGLFNPPGSGKPPFVPSRTVPLAEGQAYGWIIHLKATKTKIKWREEFTLPSPPTTWGDAQLQGPQSISEDGRVSITETQVELDAGVILNIWAVAPGDPAGRYVIRVIIENAVERVFEFDVQ